MSGAPTRTIVFAATALMLAACGFHPLYGQMGSGPNAVAGLASVYIEPIPERIGYTLRNDLLDLFNSRAEATGLPYRLKIVLKAEEKGLGLKQNAAITRYSYHLVAHYQLEQAGTGKILKKGDVHSLTSYNVVQSPYATVVADKDAQDRAADDMAERLRTELAVYFLNAPGGGS